MGFPLINDLCEMFEERWADDAAPIATTASSCSHPGLEDSDEEDEFDFWAHSATLDGDCKESLYADLALHPNTEIFNMALDDDCCCTEPLQERALAAKLSRNSQSIRGFLQGFPFIDDLCEMFEEQWADSATISTTASSYSIPDLDDSIFAISSDEEEDVLSDTAFEDLEACTATMGNDFVIHFKTEVSNDNCPSLQLAGELC